MNAYNPDQAPPPDEWLALDEDERLALVQKWHRKQKIRLPSQDAHASLHVIVENQLAEKHPAACDALQRFMNDSLSRHDAIHAIATVVANHMHDLLSGKLPPGKQAVAEYDQQLRKFTAQDWLNSGT
jgi:hypothetical protein